jgi:hypothetical protein
MLHMNPRIKTNVKWTTLPPELCDQIRNVFIESFSENTKTGKVIVEGRIYPTELMLRVGFLENGRLRQANFEVSLDMNPKKQNALELIHFAVDCAGSMMGEYFDKEQNLEDFPLEWEKFQVEGKTAFIQVTTINSSLESEADRLLGRTKDDLVQGDDITEAEEAVISMLGLDKEELEDLPEDDDAIDSDEEEHVHGEHCSHGHDVDEDQPVHVHGPGCAHDHDDDEKDVEEEELESPRKKSSVGKKPVTKSKKNLH